MVDSFRNGLGLGSGQPGLAAADSKGGIARLGTPRATNLPGSADPAPLAPTVSAMPVPAEPLPASRSVEAKGLVRELASAPPVDSARVAELKAKIAMGAYSVDPGRIADAMIASEAVSKSAT